VATVATALANATADVDAVRMLVRAAALAEGVYVSEQCGDPSYAVVQTCQCAPGWTGDGCNVCDGATQPACAANAGCVEDPPASGSGNISCTCLDGYHGDGYVPSPLLHHVPFTTCPSTTCLFTTFTTCPSTTCPSPRAPPPRAPPPRASPPRAPSRGVSRSRALVAHPVSPVFPVLLDH
jgi:hypothetical protein